MRRIVAAKPQLWFLRVKFRKNDFFAEATRKGNETATAVESPRTSQTSVERVLSSV